MLAMCLQSKVQNKTFDIFNSTSGDMVCPQMFDFVDWPMTAAGTEAKVNCPEGYIAHFDCD